MVEPRQSAMQRIQVGLVGLVVVLLFVSLANMVLDRVTGGPSRSEAPGMSETAAEVPDEPLAELGVTPVAKEEAAPVVENSPPPTNNVGQRPAGSRR
jgi:hypothetical protein